MWIGIVLARVSLEVPYNTNAVIRVVMCGVRIAPIFSLVVVVVVIRHQVVGRGAPCGRRGVHLPLPKQTTIIGKNILPRVHHGDWGSL